MLGSKFLPLPGNKHTPNSHSHDIYRCSHQQIGHINNEHQRHKKVEQQQVYPKQRAS
jgi:hypothetical protein